MAMRRLALFIAVLVTTTALAQDQSVAFSNFSTALKLISFDQKTSTAHFSGNITVTGTLFIEFDMAAPERADGVNFAKFVPDAPSASRLPAVLAGFYPGAVRYVSLEPAQAALEAGFGKEEAMRLAHGREPFLSKAVRVILHNDPASVECDSRDYVSSEATVEPADVEQVAMGVTGQVEVPHGCQQGALADGLAPRSPGELVP
jgi:hypothetical protein